MTISDASEIQFWPVGEDSFNTENEGYTDDYYCFHQKFLCSGTRKLQVVGGPEESQELRLSILEDDEEIASIDFDQTNDSMPGTPGTPVPMVIDALEDWLGTVSDPARPDWTTGIPNPTVNLPGAFLSVASSEVLYTDFPFVEGNQYSITIEWTRVVNSGTSNPRTSVLMAMDSSFNSLVQQTHADSAGANTVTLTFTAGAGYTKIGFRHASGSDVDITITDVSGIETPADEPGTPATHYLNTVEFNPFDLGWCGKRLSFKIYNTFTIPDETEIFYSDSVDFVSTWSNAPDSGRIQIQYKSIQNFAGLIYDSESEYFSIELEGRFRKERKITAQKALELTEQILNTAASVKKQRRLTLDDLTDYMHTKVTLILAHAASGSVLINGKEWSIEESYEEGERPGSYPLTPAEIWLTEKEYYRHNVI